VRKSLLDVALAGEARPDSWLPTSERALRWLVVWHRRKRRELEASLREARSDVSVAEHGLAEAHKRIAVLEYQVEAMRRAHRGRQEAREDQPAPVQPLEPVARPESRQAPRSTVPISPAMQDAVRRLFNKPLPDPNSFSDEERAVAAGRQP
jgi:hypothetical protein